MNRKEFLNDWNRAKVVADVLRDGDNQFAYIAGSLVSAEPHYNWKFDKGVVTTEDCQGDVEDIWDTYIDGEPTEWKEYQDCLVILYYRSNEFTTMFDFYNNVVDRGFDDWQESWKTEYWVADKDGNMTELEVEDWQVCAS